MISIHLSNCSFYAYHGCHEEEAIVGGLFTVDVTLSFAEKAPIVYLEDTIDYSAVYEIVKIHMQKRYALLESLAIDIAAAIHAADKKVEKINITIFKNNPPLSNFSGNLGVSFSKEFN